jgi:hypothetical protein
VADLLNHRPDASRENIRLREGTKVGRRQKTLRLAANQKASEKSATVFKAFRFENLLLLQHENTVKIVIVK